MSVQLSQSERVMFELRYGFEKATEALAAFRHAWEEEIARGFQRLHDARIADKKRAARQEKLYQAWRAEKEKDE